jgi:hypothetical protein
LVALSDRKPSHRFERGLTTHRSFWAVLLVEEVEVDVLVVEVHVDVADDVLRASSSPASQRQSQARRGGPFPEDRDILLNQNSYTRQETQLRALLRVARLRQEPQINMTYK